MFYAVRKGRVPGIYRCWEEARAQVERFPGCEHKRFELKKAAEHYMNTGESTKKQRTKITTYFKRLQKSR